MDATTPLTVSEARDQLASIINRAQNHEPVFLSRCGRRVVAVIDADDLERLTGLAEDMADIRAAEEAREEMRRTQREPIPWEEVKADLGLQGPTLSPLPLPPNGKFARSVRRSAAECKR
ncbi:MAG: type II toxin-antitoxin system Phd/YefM family antitoxin [Terrimesophilobacter sp.]